MRVGVAALLSCGRQVGVVWGLALVLLSGIASAQQTINSTVLGPVYGDDNSITVTTSGTINGVAAGTGVISTGTNTTTALTNAGTIVGYSRGVLNLATGSFGTITNSGTITGNWAVATSGTIGTFDNQLGGSIIGSDYAFIADGGTITTLQNAGSVTGYNAFILANTAIGTFTNSGSAASSGGNGLRLGTGGSVGSFSNSGLISGQPGVQLEAATSTLTVTNSGTISGFNGFISSGTLGTLTNTSTGLVNGGNLGFVQRGGSVDQISNAGVITSGGYGIGTETGGTIGKVTNSGTVSGADWGLILQTTTGTVNNLAGGSISGTNGAGINSSASLTLLDNAGSISSGNRGTWISGGTTNSIDNSGTISGGYSGLESAAGSVIGTVLNTGTLSGGAYGAVLATTGALTNAAGALITGTANDGVYLLGGETLSLVDNAGTISGVVTGFNGVDGSTVGSLTNSGTISGGYAVVIATSGTVTNAAGGLLSATTTDGVYVRAGASSLAGLVNAGAITAVSRGVNINAGTTNSIDNSGTISGGYSGLESVVGSVIGTVLNTGTLSGGAYGAVLATTGTLTNAAGALINGSANEGIYLHGGQTLTLLDNAGTINAAGTGVYGVAGSTIGMLSNSGTIQAGGNGLQLAASGTVTNLAGALISGTVGDAIVTTDSVQRIDNAGTLTGGNAGIQVIAGSHVGLIDNAGLIDGGSRGLFTQFGGSVTTLTNSGTIQGGLAGGIVRMTSGTLTNSGLFRGTYQGLTTTGTVDTLTNTAAGRIEGGLSLNGVATTVVNDGLISDPTGDGLDHYGTTGTITNNGTITGAWGVYQDGTLTNFTNSASGLIHGDDIGFYADYTVDAIDNFGTITGNTTAGVEFDTSFSNIGVLTNHAGALIESSAGDGVLVGTYGTDYAADTVSNAGSIRGANSGVRVENGRLLSLVNTGTIAYSGTGSGPAVVVGPSGILGDASGTKGPAIVSTGSGALLAGGIINSGTIYQGFRIENQDVSVGAGRGLGVFDGGTLNVVNGNLTFTDGTLQLGADVSVNGGSGTFFNEATLELFGTQTVTGNFEQTSGAVSVMDLLGLTLGSYGHLDISGTSVFAGGLALDDTGLAGGLAPGETFELFGFGSYTGGFASLAVNGVPLSSLGGGLWSYGSLTLTELWTNTTMSLSVSGPAPVPEIDPASFGSALALLLGSLGLLERKARG